MASRLRGLALPVLLAVIATSLTLAVLAGVGEWLVRKRERTRTTAPGTMSMLFYRHTRLMHGLVRGMDYYGWVHMGRQGFRGAREVSETPPDSVYRIIAVGGSTTFDASTSGDSAAWPARLEQILDSVAAPRRFEVLNAGVPGFQVFDDLVRLEYELHKYKPSLLILYQGHNDLFNTLAAASRSGDLPFDPRPGEIPAVTPWGLWLERNSLLYHKLRSKWQAIRLRSTGRARGARAQPADFERVLEGGIATYARNVRAFIAVAHSMGIDVVVPQAVYTRESVLGSGVDSSVTALWRVAFPFAPPDVVRDGYARYDSASRAVTAAAGVTHLPGAEPTLWVADSYTYGDAIHFSDSGAWRFARHLSGAILAEPGVRAFVGSPAGRASADR